MAYPTTITLGTGNKVTADYQSQEAHITVTYELERHETNIDLIVLEKAEEVERLHSALWRRMREVRTEQQAALSGQSESNGATDRTARNGHAARRRRGTLAEAAPPSAGKEGIDGTQAAEQTNSAAEGPDVAPPTEPAPEAAPTDLAQPTPQEPTQTAPASADLLTDPQHHAICTLVARTGVSEQRLTEFLKGKWGKGKIETLTRSEAGSLLLELQRAEHQRVAAAAAAA